MDPYVQIGTNQSQGHHLLVFLSILIFINLKFKFLILSFFYQNLFCIIYLKEYVYKN